MTFITACHFAMPHETTTFPPIKFLCYPFQYSTAYTQVFQIVSFLLLNYEKNTREANSCCVYSTVKILNIILYSYPFGNNLFGKGRTLYRTQSHLGKYDDTESIYDFNVYKKQNVSRRELVKNVALMSNGLDGSGEWILKLSSGQVRCHLSLLLPLE